MSLKLDDIFAISLQIVKDFDYVAGVQPQTYGRVDLDPDLTGTSFGYTYADYTRGEFYSRAWENGGLNPDEIVAGFPAVFAELLAPTPDSYDGDGDQLTIAFLFIDKLDCQDCPKGTDRSGAAVTTNLYQLGRSFMRELMSYGLYEVRRGTAPVVYEWLSEGRANYLKSDSTTVKRIDRLAPYIVDEPDRFARWGNYPEMRGLVTSVRFNFCAPSVLPFRYDAPVVDALASNDCPC